LLEDSDIDLDFYYVSSGVPLAFPIPEHDALIVGMGVSDQNRNLLASLEQALVQWPKPVINAPHHIPTTERNLASVLLQNVPGLVIAPTLRIPRPVLQSLATDDDGLRVMFEGFDFPIIVRPVISHGGHGLEKIECSGEIPAYLSKVDEPEFFLSQYFDYRSQDGLFRKFRVVLIDGVAFAYHMAVSSRWMIHYVNAGMYEDAGKRAEEASFMAHFDDFVQRHQAALKAIHERTNLDYVCIDCAETPDGQLLVFEIDHAMVVHDMDPEDLFPYKRPAIQKIQQAFRDFLVRRIAGHAF
ncbi:MAG: hypothetical protein WCP34_12270, partial [Pseudomonadota bacterium]